MEFLERILSRKVDRRRALGITALGLFSAVPGVGEAKTNIDSLDHSDEGVKLITADGKVVEVDRKFIRKEGKKRLTNKQLRKWIASSR